MGGGEVVWHSVEVEEDTYSNTLTDLPVVSAPSGTSFVGPPPELHASREI